MESKSLREYKVPDYPKKEEVQAQPSLLRKSVERRWQKLYDFGISGMLVAGLSLSGCDKKPATNTTTTNEIEASPNLNPNASQTNNVTPAKVAALIAPIFEHGEGRGATGCVAVSPPCFLSEDEALVVIREEFKKHGINLNKEKVVLTNVKISPGKNEMFALRSSEKEKAEPLEIDLADSDNDINIEFISEDDFFKLGGIRSGSTVQGYYFKQIAEEVRSELKYNTQKGVYAIFYDPMSRPSTNDIYQDKNIEPLDKWKLVQQRAIDSSKELLRNQVSDFAQWLKEQGVIK